MKPCVAHELLSLNPRKAAEQVSSSIVLRAPKTLAKGVKSMNRLVREARNGDLVVSIFPSVGDYETS